MKDKLSRTLRRLEGLPLTTIWGVQLAGIVLAVFLALFVSLLLGLIVFIAAYAFHFHFFVCPHCLDLLPITLNPSASPYCPKCGKLLNERPDPDGGEAPTE